ncbi:MAG: hypothetical protein GEU81_13760, partial [Nitriliruptorales bacterium]|nr:hypothetical protein [Nitriliruptorales bacterium]
MRARCPKPAGSPGPRRPARGDRGRRQPGAAGHPAPRCEGWRAAPAAAVRAPTPGSRSRRSPSWLRPIFPATFACMSPQPRLPGARPHRGSAHPTRSVHHGANYPCPPATFSQVTRSRGQRSG